MAAVTHEVTPEGDAILVVKNHNAPFAPCPSPSSTKSAAPGESANAIDNKNPSQEVRIRVSSAHLKLASPVFKKALSGEWKEAATLKDSGSVEIETSEWDVDALLLLMRIFHCQLSDLPKKLDIERLAKLLVLVDYYECQSLLGFITEKWPTCVYSFQDVRQGMIMFWVAWTIEHTTAFSHYASEIIHHADRPITSLGLPFPSKIIDELNKRREAILSHNLEIIRRQESDWNNLKFSCIPICKYVCVGTLKDFIAENKIFTADAPYEGFSLRGLRDTLKDLKAPKWREWVDERQDPCTLRRIHECKNSQFTDLHAKLFHPVLDKVVLELSEFKTHSD
ncbi:hypothetical protein BJX68DRAFT_267379 [Aspergillus pseudodeflectus]|uniref:BTB domain-containing protein n=1 Tax=Aspergillus pseudodeflectus TaxID=176178 RepID=A0ABR4K9S8_9EURO